MGGALTAPKGLLTTWEVRPGDKDKNFEVLQALDFLASTGDPIFTLTGGHGLSPQGFIVIGVNARFERPVSEGC